MHNKIEICFLDTEKPNVLKKIVSKLKAKASGKSLNDIHALTDHDSKSIDEDRFKASPNNVVKICAVNNNAGHLLQLKFDKNKRVPRQVFKLITLAVPYNQLLTSITVNSGINNGCLYELCKILNNGNITDVCLDNTSISKGCYDMLLKGNHKLKNLSMARCKIDDDLVKRLSTHLKHPLPASRTLQILNLASNFITDLGAKYLAETLRSNRSLVYLNLAGNVLTDNGAEEILNVLAPFLVTDEELASFRTRNMLYLRKKEYLVMHIYQNLKTVEIDAKKVSKKKLISKNLKDIKSVSAPDLEQICWDKARSMANARLGVFSEPFSSDDVFTEDDNIYCYGNNRLAYINVSYNNISYQTLKKIAFVLIKQQYLCRKPRGLVNVSIEGNNVPRYCAEIEQIRAILLSMQGQNRKTSQNKIKK